MIAVTVSATMITAPFVDRSLTQADQIASFGILSCFVSMFVAIEMPIAHWELPVGVGLVLCLALIQIGRIRSDNRVRHAK
jgi:hypothetical protein